MALPLSDGFVGVENFNSLYPIIVVVVQKKQHQACFMLNNWLIFNFYFY
jgi:hypothetical protein